uniref:Uncharacterized protein n=1 Tax=Aegilops tauschii subsp. strangulata TaxID=200361 RepID=A0A453HLY5_AEGTS
ISSRSPTLIVPNLPPSPHKSIYIPKAERRANRSRIHPHTGEEELDGSRSGIHGQRAG